ncbi:MAG: hypothetical protein AAFQ07_11795 [Chloroflexota bacterium]
MTEYTPKKKKNDSQYQRVSPTNFVLIATLAHLSAYIVSSIISTTLVSAMPIEGVSIRTALFTATPQLLIIAMQAMLLRWQFRWSGTRWFIASVIGWAMMLGSVMLYLLSADPTSLATLSIVLTILSLVSTLVISGIQAVVLSKYVSRAWLWIVASFASLFVGGIANTALVSIINTMGNWSIPFVQLAHRGAMGLVGGLFFALTLTLLVRLAARGKRKRITDTDVDNDDAQVESASRLRDDDPTDERAFYADERLAQQNQL